MTTNACIPATPAEARAAAAAFPVGLGPARNPSSFLGTAEPALAEMMADEVIRRLMARDGVRPDQLLSLIEEVRGRLI